MEQNIYKGLIAFVKAHTTITKVYQMCQNRTAQPNEDFCILSFLYLERQGTNIKEDDLINNEIDTIEHLLPTIQFDFYGSNSYTNSIKIQMLLRDEIGFNFLSAYNFAPIDCSQVRNLSAQTIQQDQYVKRFGFDLEINGYETISITAEFFDEATINKLKEVTTNGYIGE